jgi:cell division protein FtsW
MEKESIKSKSNLKNEWGNLNKIDLTLLISCLFLIIFGLIILASALSGKSLNVYNSELWKQIFFTTWVGGGLCLFASQLDYHFWLKRSQILVALSIGMLLFLTGFTLVSYIQQIRVTELIQQIQYSPIKPYFANGALRWISFVFGFTVQPSELAKLSVLLYFAYYFNKLKDKSISWKEIKNPMWVFVIISILISTQPDLGSVVILSVIILLSMWIGKVPYRILTTLLIIGVFLVGILIASYSYRTDRVNTFLTFFNSPKEACVTSQAINSNFQICQVRRAIATGGYFGKGYGNGESKIIGLVPEVTTDGILSVVGEELGLTGMLLLISLYLIIFYRGISIAWQMPDLGGKILASGISFWIILQAFINMAGITGLIPLKGMPLPFISEGGSAAVLNMFSLGILFNLSTQRKTVYKTKEVENRSNYGKKLRLLNDARF